MDLTLKFYNTLDEFRSEIEMSATSAIAGNPDYYVLPVNNRQYRKIIGIMLN